MEAVHRHKMLRQRRLDSLISMMQADAYKLMADGKYAEAEQAVQAFRAPPAPEIEKARQDLLEEIRKKASVSPKPAISNQ